MNILLSGFEVDGVIPVWGVLVMILAGVGAFAALRMQMAAHIKNDDERFSGVNAMLMEIRGDVKTILRNGHDR